MSGIDDQCWNCVYHVGPAYRYPRGFCSWHQKEVDDDDSCEVQIKKPIRENYDIDEDIDWDGTKQDSWEAKRLE